MIQDLADHPAGTVLKADICIIGAGPAGISMARKLDGKKLDVLVLESGGRKVEKAQQELAKATSSGVKYKRLNGNRLRQLGGTSGHWAGQSMPMSPLDFETRDWVPHSGWPIPYDEYRKWVPEAADVCGLGREPFTYEEWGSKAGLGASPFEALAIDALRFSTPRVHFGEAYAGELEASKNITVVLHATATGLEPTADGKAVKRLKVSHLDGREVFVEAKKFVLATGATENSRMLLLAQRQTKHPFGNEHDQVGRYTMEHPRTDSGHVVLERRDAAAILATHKRSAAKMRLRFDLRLDDDTQRKLKILNHSVFLVKPAKPNPVSKGVVAMLDGLADEASYDKRNFQLRVRLEHSPLPDSRVTLSDQTDAFGLNRLNLAFAFGPLEAKTVAEVEKNMARHLGRAQVGRMLVPTRKRPRAWAKKVGWQDHYMGGTRMDADPAKGVVDANCKVHGLDNLYAAGSSVFPTCGHANPTMNLVAMSLRLADHLAQEAS